MSNRQRLALACYDYIMNTPWAYAELGHAVLALERRAARGLRSAERELSIAGSGLDYTVSWADTKWHRLAWGAMQLAARDYRLSFGGREDEPEWVDLNGFSAVDVLELAIEQRDRFPSA